MHIYAHMYIYIYMYIRICACIHTHTHAHKYIFIHTHIYACVYVYIKIQRTLKSIQQADLEGPSKQRAEAASNKSSPVGWKSATAARVGCMDGCVISHT